MTRQNIKSIKLFGAAVFGLIALCSEDKDVKAASTLVAVGLTASAFYPEETQEVLNELSKRRRSPRYPQTIIID